MYPVVFEIFGFPISSFGLMLAAAFLVGTWIAAGRMRELGMDPDKATSLLIWVMVGGIGGSKLYFAVDTHLREGLPFLSLLLAREGITWYGGLLGGILFGIIGGLVHRLPLKALSDCIALALPVGQAMGRIGCFLVGDDYGRVTDAPWGVAFPKGAPPTLEPVHPTQLYEVAWLVLVAAWLWRRRRTSPLLFGEYLALAAAGRFVIEFWRVNPRVAAELTEAQWIALGLALVGGGLWLRRRLRGPAAAAA